MSLMQHGVDYWHGSPVSALIVPICCCRFLMKNAQNETPLFLAAKTKNASLISSFIYRKVEFNAPDQVSSVECQRKTFN